MSEYIQCSVCNRVISDQTEDTHCDCQADIDMNAFPIACRKCFVPLYLEDGCEWPDQQPLYCWSCAHERIRDLEASK